jgi:hypothetical protein
MKHHAFNSFVARFVLASGLHHLKDRLKRVSFLPSSKSFEKITFHLLSSNEDSIAQDIPRQQAFFFSPSHNFL